MRSIKKSNKQMQKINLIPILDAIFIFIFFLLMSAQFIDIYKIETEVPSISTLSEEQESKIKPLNLYIEIHKNKVIIKTGLDYITHATVSLNNKKKDLEKINNILIKLKIKNMDETTVTVAPSENVSYKSIIRIIDSLKSPLKTELVLKGHNKKGNKRESKDLFPKIVFASSI